MVSMALILGHPCGIASCQCVRECMSHSSKGPLFNKIQYSKSRDIVIPCRPPFTSVAKAKDVRWAQNHEDGCKKEDTRQEVIHRKLGDS